MKRQAEKPDAVLMTFEEVRKALRPMGRNQVYEAFRTGQIAGGTRIGDRWYAVRAAFNRVYRDGGAA